MRCFQPRNSNHKAAKSKSQLALLVLILTLAMTVFSSASARSDTLSGKADSIEIALLHLSLTFADLEKNYQLIESSARLAAANGAQWVVTPELALTGYRFDLALGTDWISTGPDDFVKRAQVLAKELNITLFLSHLERSEENEKAYNTLFVIGAQGRIVGRHHKINTIPISEDWSTPGTQSKPVTVDNRQVGLLICADAWPVHHASSLKSQGAEFIVSTASWGPGLYGPGDTWEKRSLETGLPLFVANKTGLERGIDQSDAVSVVSFAGKRLIEHSSKDSTILLVKWNTKENKVENQQVIHLTD